MKNWININLTVLRTTKHSLSLTAFEPASRAIARVLIGGGVYIHIFVLIMPD